MEIVFLINKINFLYVGEWQPMLTLTSSVVCGDVARG
jgi:hypothetical protein